MAKRGDQARQVVADTIAKAFGDNFICCQDKKIYVWAPDGLGGEKIQFAISATMPKVQVTGDTVTVNNNDAAWSDTPSAPAPTGPVTLSAEDQAKVEALMRELGL